MRFTHANRHCPDHPYATLTRSDDFVLKPVSGNSELSHEVTRWLERYKLTREREDRTPTSKNSSDQKKKWKTSCETFKRLKSRKGLIMDAAVEQENVVSSHIESNANCRDFKRHQGLPSRLNYNSEGQDSQDETQDDEDNSCLLFQVISEDDDEILNKKSFPKKLERLQPKKRWLQTACMEQQLAKPLKWDSSGEQRYILDDFSYSAQWSLSESNFDFYSPEEDVAPVKVEKIETYPLPSVIEFKNVESTSPWILEENESRPTVLMLANKPSQSLQQPQMQMQLSPPVIKNLEFVNTDGPKVIVVTKEEHLSRMRLPRPSEDSQTWMGALALMELAKTEKAARALRDQKEQQQLELNTSYHSFKHL